MQRCAKYAKHQTVKIVFYVLIDYTLRFYTAKTLLARIAGTTAQGRQILYVKWENNPGP